MIKNLVVPFKAKLMMLGAIVYLISPIDLIPDLLIGPGMLDDALVVPGLLMFALKAVMAASAQRPASAQAPVKRSNYSDS